MFRARLCAAAARPREPGTAITGQFQVNRRSFNAIGSFMLNAELEHTFKSKCLVLHLSSFQGGRLDSAPKWDVGTQDAFLFDLI